MTDRPETFDDDGPCCADCVDMRIDGVEPADVFNLPPGSCCCGHETPTSVEDLMGGECDGECAL